MVLCKMKTQNLSVTQQLVQTFWHQSRESALHNSTGHTPGSWPWGLEGQAGRQRNPLRRSQTQHLSLPPSLPPPGHLTPFSALSDPRILAISLARCLQTIAQRQSVTQGTSPQLPSLWGEGLLWRQISTRIICTFTLLL